MVYQWKNNEYKVSAEEVGKMCKNLEDTGGLTAKRLVDENRNQDTLLHNYFEWNNEKAGENWREQQARMIIRSLVIVKEKENEEIPTVRAFVNLKSQDSGRAYYNTIRVLKNQDTREILLMHAKRDLESFSQKYQSFNEFAKIIDEINRK